MKKKVSTAQIIAAVIIFFCSCNADDKKTAAPAKDTLDAVRTNPDKKVESGQPEKPAIINILDTVSPKRIVVYMKDSAKTFDRISIKLAQIYGVKLAEVLKKNGLKMTGAPIAWYKTNKPPYFFEAGIPVDKRPAKFGNTVFVREMTADSVTMAHFYGPYNLLTQGYDAIKERMKEEKRTAKGMPYEIYAGDPVDANGKPVDPYKVRTDIVFPVKENN